MVRRISVIVLKEWRESLRNKMILFGALFLPLFLVAMSVYLVYQGRGVDNPAAQVVLFNTALMYFLLLPAIIPLAIAVYSIVGEKEQSSLEPLLATPISDLELFLGKALASVLPALAINWISFALSHSAHHLQQPLDVGESVSCGSGGPRSRRRQYHRAILCH
jgi:ABC-type transport system involved in multi-copper enzyme maturation permease subunit